MKKEGVYKHVFMQKISKNGVHLQTWKFIRISERTWSKCPKVGQSVDWWAVWLLASVIARAATFR